MPLSSSDREFLQSLYNRVRDHALQPDKPEDKALYYELYKDSSFYDPIAKIQDTIEWSGPESVTFLSGFNGCGKTTELYRLKSQLEQAGYSVLMANFEDYLNPNEAIDVSELLLVLAGAFGDRAEQDLANLNLSLTKDHIWERLWHYLNKTEVELKEVGFKGEFGVADLGKAGADLKLNLRGTPTFRQRIRKLLEAKVAYLKGEVDRQIKQGVDAIKLRNGDRPVVFIFDSFEKIQSFHDETVTRSVETLFNLHLRMLAVPYVHMVYSVPPWLKFVKQSVGSIFMMPTARLFERGEARHEDGWKAVRGVVGKRFTTSTDWQKLFGPPAADGTYPLAEIIIGNSGGDFRTLFALLREVLLRANRLDSLPVTPLVVEDACQSVREQMLPIPVDDAKLLARISRTKCDPLESDSAENVATVTRLLATHRLLYFKNGGEWYDVHPLIREEVRAVADRNTAPATP